MVIVILHGVTMLNVVLMSVFMLSVIMLSVVLMSAVAPPLIVGSIKFFLRLSRFFYKSGMEFTKLLVINLPSAMEFIKLLTIILHIGMEFTNFLTIILQIGMEFTNLLMIILQIITKIGKNTHKTFYNIFHNLHWGIPLPEFGLKKYARRGLWISAQDNIIMHFLCPLSILFSSPQNAQLIILNKNTFLSWRISQSDFIQLLLLWVSGVVTTTLDHMS